MANRQLKVPKNLLCEDSGAHTLNLLIRWYCDLLDEVGDRAMLKNPAKVQQPYLKIMLCLQFVGIPIFALVQNYLSRKAGSEPRITNSELHLTKARHLN
ncbi:MAG TPA: hypothetical protein VER14_04925 [Phototrophicaceae bacterium]|nr:hypothetical protein [Phototrophicaceae bacterium]